MKLEIIILCCLMYYGSCKTPEGFNRRIFNGYPAPQGYIPYQILLYVPLEDGNYAFCGGAILSSEYIITAAHCVHQPKEMTFFKSYPRSRKPSFLPSYFQTQKSTKGLNMFVFAGMTDSQNLTNVQIRKVFSVHIHDKYDSSTITDDIAIVKVYPQLVPTNNIKPIRLAGRAYHSPFIFDGWTARVSGWGQTYDHETGIHRILQFGEIRIMPHNACSQLLANYSFGKTQICTDKSIFAGPCQGDSGGPLVAYYRTPKPMLIGLVSWGLGDCINPYPDVYIYIPSYLNWIHSITGIRLTFI